MPGERAVGEATAVRLLEDLEDAARCTEAEQSQVEPSDAEVQLDDFAEVHGALPIVLGIHGDLEACARVHPPPEKVLAGPIQVAPDQRRRALDAAEARWDDAR